MSSWRKLVKHQNFPGAAQKFCGPGLYKSNLGVTESLLDWEESQGGDGLPGHLSDKETGRWVLGNDSHEVLPGRNLRQVKAMLVRA